MIIIDGTDIVELGGGQTPRRISFSKWDGDVYNGLSGACLGSDKVNGVLVLRFDKMNMSPEPAGAEAVCVVVARDQEKGNARHNSDVHVVGGHRYHLKGFSRKGQSWEEHEVKVVPVRDDLFSRARGLLETDVMATRKVFLKGLGSFGSDIALPLAQSGVGEFFLMDHDRLEVSNLVRHAGGLSHIGRFKTKVMADLIHEKNPYAKVHTFEEKLDTHNLELGRDLVRKANLIIDTGDERKGKLLLNRICLQEGKPLIISGAFRRAHGGQVLRVRPGKTACYQCFCQLLKMDGNAFPETESEPVAYSDRPVPIEPGLSIDIKSICHMAAKLALQELLQDMPTTLRSLDQDLEAHWYWFLNRRETGTAYQSLEPLGFGIDGIRILRWYGIDFPRNPDCPACGDLASISMTQIGRSVTCEDISEFRKLHSPREVHHGR